MNLYEHPTGHRRLRQFRVTLRTATYFITCTTAERRELFTLPAAAQVVGDALCQYHRTGYVHGFAWVIMPDHIHWVFQLRVGTLANIMRVMKSWTGFRVKRIHSPQPPRVWSTAYHDHMIRPHEDLARFINYVVFNPVRAGLVTNPMDYPYLYAEHELMELAGSEPLPVDPVLLPKKGRMRRE